MAAAVVVVELVVAAASLANIGSVVDDEIDQTNA